MGASYRMEPGASLPAARTTTHEVGIAERARTQGPVAVLVKRLILSFHEEHPAEI